MKVEMTKAPYGSGPLVTESPESWHSQTKRCQLQAQIVTSDSHQLATALGIPVFATGNAHKYMYLPGGGD